MLAARCAAEHAGSSRGAWCVTLLLLPVAVMPALRRPPCQRSALYLCSGPLAQDAVVQAALAAVSTSEWTG